VVTHGATPGTRIRSVLRASQLLMLMATLTEEERTVKRLAEELGTSIPSVYHLLNTLVDAKLLARDEHKRYVLGLSVGVLASAYAAQSVPPPELMLPLKRIVESTGETAYLSAWRQGSPVILAQLDGTHAVQVADLRPGFHEAAHARAAGKVLLALGGAARRDQYLAGRTLQKLTPHTVDDRDALERELRLVGKSGYATEVEEFSVGVASASVPIWSSGMLLGAYTVSAPVERYRLNLDRYLQVLRGAATTSELNQPFEEEDGQA
jgi:IclR family acetate operon transcriptional repressor